MSTHNMFSWRNKKISILFVEKKSLIWTYAQALIKTRKCAFQSRHLGQLVQSVVSLTSSLKVISLTVLGDSIHNILIFFAEKNVFC